MLKVIDVNIDSIDDCRHKFKPSDISDDLAEYLLKQCRATLYSDSFEIAFYSLKEFTKEEKKELTDMIREHFGLELREAYIIKEKNNIVNLLCFLFGIIFLFIDVLVKLNPIVSEIVLILGWVLIWEASYNLFFGEIRNNVKISRIKKLIDCKVKYYEKQ